MTDLTHGGDRYWKPCGCCVVDADGHERHDHDPLHCQHVCCPDWDEEAV